MSNLIFKKLKNLKTKNFGLNNSLAQIALIRFGVSSKYSMVNKSLFNFISPLRIGVYIADFPVKFLQNLILSQNTKYGVAIIKQIGRRVELLKFNRSWRGVRHFQSLPVRGQRTKTNARTRKIRRKNG